MTGSRLLVGVASVFAGITGLMVVLALIYRTPVPLVIGVPFGVTGYLMWYQGTGRLEGRMRERTAGQRRKGDQRHVGDTRRRARGRGRGRSQDRHRDRIGGGPNRQSPGSSGPSRREAYRILDLDPGADESRVKRAYREKVKATHPDRGGDEAEFKRVKNAYERLAEHG